MPFACLIGGLGCCLVSAWKRYVVLVVAVCRWLMLLVAVMCVCCVLFDVCWFVLLLCVACLCFVVV